MFFHGSSSKAKISFKLLPPKETKVLSEANRKNLDKVFFTNSYKYAKIYAGRACQAMGGNPVIYRVILFDNQKNVSLNKNKGCEVYMTDYAFVEEIYEDK